MSTAKKKAAKAVDGYVIGDPINAVAWVGEDVYTSLDEAKSVMSNAENQYPDGTTIYRLVPVSKLVRRCALEDVR